MAEKFDLAEQTARDYSIVVLNPPEDAYDIDEWKQFFESAAENVHVTLCSVILDNHDLVNALVERRKLLLKIQNRLPFGVEFDFDNVDQFIEQCVEPSWIQRKLLFQKSSRDIQKEIEELRKDISKFAKKDYKVSSVYITLETEEAQRKLLSKITTSIFAAVNQKIPSEYPQECLFRRKFLLRVEKPDEPDSIRWGDAPKSDMVCVLPLFTLSCLDSYDLIFSYFSKIIKIHF